MKRAIQLIAWTLPLYLLLLMLASSVGQATRYVSWSTNDVYVFETEHGLEVMSEFDVIGDHEHADKEFVYVSSRPQFEHGPIPGLFECITKTSFLSTPDSIRIYSDEEVDPQHRLAIYNAIVAFAQNDPELVGFRPGQPPKWSFSLVDFVAESLGALVFLGTPPAIILFIRWLVGKAGNKTHDQRQQLGVCVHCEYDCANLPSPICPECGRLHKAEVVPAHA